MSWVLGQSAWLKLRLQRGKHELALDQARCLHTDADLHEAACLPSGSRLRGSLLGTPGDTVLGGRHGHG